MSHTLRRFALLAAVLFGSLSTSAPARQDAPPVQASAAVATPATQSPTRPALWKVADADTTIYLFGTVHALPKGIEWFRGGISDAFLASGELVTEVAEDSPEKMQAIVLSKALMPPDKTLRSLLPEPDRAKFEAAMTSLGMPVAAFDRFEPWYAAVALSAMPLMRDGYAAENGVEAALDAQAKALGRPHKGLETADYQLSLFDTLPTELQVHYLSQVVDSLPTVRAELDAMVEQWRKGDAEKLAELMNSEEDDPRMMEALLINRNKAWAQWIKTRLAMPGTVFIAVGAGHLAGKGSVQEQLDALGLSHSRVQ